MKKRFRVLTTGSGLEDSLNSLYMDGYTFLAATDTAVIMENVQVTDTDMRRDREGWNALEAFDRVQAKMKAEGTR